jgi:hypothetical protein
MRVTHTLMVSALCPVKPNMDFYECQIVTDRLIRVEDITKITDPYMGKKIFQEDLCQKLANSLKCEVTLKGEHSGVKTQVTCEPRKPA